MILSDNTTTIQPVDNEDDKMQFLTRREIYKYLDSTGNSSKKPLEKKHPRIFRKFKKGLANLIS